MFVDRNYNRINVRWNQGLHSFSLCSTLIINSCWHALALMNCAENILTIRFTCQSRVCVTKKKVLESEKFCKYFENCMCFFREVKLNFVKNSHNKHTRSLDIIMQAIPWKCCCLYIIASHKTNVGISLISHGFFFIFLLSVSECAVSCVCSDVEKLVWQAHSFSFQRYNHCHGVQNRNEVETIKTVRYISRINTW